MRTPAVAYPGMSFILGRGCLAGLAAGFLKKASSVPCFRISLQKKFQSGSRTLQRNGSVSCDRTMHLLQPFDICSALR